MSTIRDRLWLWGHETGSHDHGWNLPAASHITPVEATHYLGISNLMMVRYGPQPLPLDRTCVLPFRDLTQLVWSVVGAGGTHHGDELEQVLHLPELLPNLTGVIMDDFFRRDDTGSEVGVLPLDRLTQLRRRLSRPEKPLKLYVVLYDHQLDLHTGEYLQLCDKLTYWTWEAQNLRHLEENFALMEGLAPKSCGKLLGCYLWDYGGKQPMPIAAMQHQCELGLEWLRQGRIEGMIFLASCICDLGLDSVEWTRRWIDAVGKEPLLDRI